MDARTVLQARFKWAHIVLRCFVQMFSACHLQNTLLCRLQSSDSDFTGGAAAWEHASQMLEAAAHENGMDIQLQPRSICEACWQRLTIHKSVADKTGESAITHPLF
jgi:hypothetical protein